MNPSQPLVGMRTRLVDTTNFEADLRPYHCPCVHIEAAVIIELSFRNTGKREKKGKIQPNICPGVGVAVEDHVSEMGRGIMGFESR